MEHCTHGRLGRESLCPCLSSLVPLATCRADRLEKVKSALDDEEVAGLLGWCELTMTMTMMMMVIKTLLLMMMMVMMMMMMLTLMTMML